MLSKSDFRNFATIVREIIREEVPPMIQRGIDMNLAVRLSEYVTKKEHSADILDMKRSLGSLQDVVIGLDKYVRTEFPIFRHELDELKTDVTVLKGDVTVLKNDVTVLKNDVTVLKNDVAVLKSDVAILKVDVTALKADVKELNVGMDRVQLRLGRLEKPISS